MNSNIVLLCFAGGGTSYARTCLRIGLDNLEKGKHDVVTLKNGMEIPHPCWESKEMDDKFQQLRDTMSPQEFDNYHYEFYKVLSKTNVKWITKVHTAREQKMFCSAVADGHFVSLRNHNIWTVLLIRIDILSHFLTLLIHHFNTNLVSSPGNHHNLMHLTDENKKEMDEFKKEKHVCMLGIVEKYHTALREYFQRVKEWPLPINNVVFYEDLIGNYSYADLKLMMNGISVNNDRLAIKAMKFQSDTGPQRVWQNREEILNAVSNVDQLYQYFDALKDEFKLDDNYCFSPKRYGLFNKGV